MGVSVTRESRSESKWMEGIGERSVQKLNGVSLHAFFEKENRKGKKIALERERERETKWREQVDRISLSRGGTPYERVAIMQSLGFGGFVVIHFQGLSPSVAFII